MKKLFLTALMSFAALVAAPAHAQTATGNFNVVITLTSSCSLNTPSDGAMAYTSFAAGQSSATAASINVRCTNNLPYTASLNGATATASNVYTFSDAALALNYQLTLAETNLGASGANTGTGNNQAYTITPAVVTAQGGTCATTSCSSTAAHTLTITY